MAFTNYYIVLGVKNTATADEIRQAYRVLAKKYHPDKNPDNKAAEDFFKEVQQAYMVLSNPEKRRQFDLRFSYAHTQSQYQQAKQTRTQTTYTQYTGNAYQYAQQQAQNRQTQNATQRTAKKPDKSENKYIFISVGVAMALLYFIISYASRSGHNARVKQYTNAMPLQEHAAEVPPASESSSLPIADNSNVYSGHFGEEVFDDKSRNQLTVYNISTSEAVVCVVDRQSGKTIRSRYIAAGSLMEFHYIPNGIFSLKAYYGKDWDPAKTFVDTTIHGGFRQFSGFVQLNTGRNALVMEQKHSGSSIQSSAYEVRLDPSDKAQQSIDADAFFSVGH